MPTLILGAERCVLHPGTHTIGGRAPDALKLPALEWQSPVATVTVPRNGRAVIQRTTASVVVRVNDELLGIGPSELQNGAVIDFKGCRLTFETDHTGQSAVAMDPSRAPEQFVPRPREETPLTSSIGARLVNVKTGTTFALTDRRVVIGRDDTCDIVIAGMGISRRHASVSPVSGGYLLRDESANGTTVNETPVAATYLLAHGDVVRLDGEELRYDVEGMTDAVATAKNSEATQILDLSQIKRSLEGAPNGRHISCSLEIVRGPFAGATFELDKPVCAIGRAPHNDVTVRSDSVSAAHATLLRKGTLWYVVDLRSANGTYVNGSRVAGERELVSGARLKVGAVEMIFRSFTDGVDEDAARHAKKGFRRWLVSLMG
ncbi:MAG: FHA domain-containing protein [bacterium]